MSQKKDPPEQAEFRHHAASWLAENKPGPAPRRIPEISIEVVEEDLKDYLVAWQGKCYEAGLVGADYPTEYGGGGLNKAQARVLQQELRRIRARPALFSFGLWMFGPALLEFGNERWIETLRALIAAE